MSTIGKTVTWMLLIALAGAAGGGAYLWQLAQNSEQIIRGKLQQQLTDKVPDWDVSFETVSLDLSGAARLTNVTLRLRDREGPLVHVPQLVAMLDRDLFQKNQLIRIERVSLHEPTVWISRDAAGNWNWQFFTPPPQSDAPCPEIEILGGTIVVHSERTRQLPETEFSCRSLHGRLIPSGHRRYSVRIETDVDHAGALAINGSIDLTKRSWQLIGDVAALDTQQGVLDVAAGLSPELRRQVTALSDRQTRGDWTMSPEDIEQLPPFSIGNPVPIRTAAASTPRSEFSLPELGVQAQLDVHFKLQQAGAGAPLEYAVEATIHQGQIENAALPVPLYDLRGRIAATQEEVIIENVSAANGDSELHISGRLGRTADGWTKDLTVKAVNLKVDPSIRDYVHHEAARKMYDQIQPAGRFNLDVRVVHDGVSAPAITLNEFTALECSCLHEAFQYPIEKVTGSIRQEGPEFLLKLDGFAGTRPVHLEGSVRNPGPEMEARLDIHATDVPLDQRVLNALALEKYKKTRQALELLRLEGLANVAATLRRPAGAGQKFALELHVNVRNGVLDYMQFPYRITNLSGEIHYNPLDPASGPVWRFDKLQGIHANGQAGPAPVALTGRASYDQRQTPGELAVVVHAQGAPIDQDLHRACFTANPALNRIWEELNPAGMLDLDVDLRWRPGSRVDVRLPSVRLSNGRITLRPIPIEWTNVEGSFSWQNGVATIGSTMAGDGGTLSAEHQGATLQIINQGPDTAIIEIEPHANLDWHVHLEDMQIRGLVCDAELRSRLPAGMAGVISALDPQGPIDTDLGIDLKGANDTVTASWSQVVRLNGNRLTAGVVLERAIGNIEIIHGIWDGAFATVEGYIDLVSARALNMPLELVRGPFTVDGNLLTIGSPDWQIPEWRFAGPPRHTELNPYRGRELRVDRFYADPQHDGKLGLKAVALINPVEAEQTQYRAAVTMGDASLRAWAIDRRIAGQKLRGSVNGHVDFRGRGTSGRAIVGSGFMKISQAEIFELPVFAQMMPTLNFKRGNQTLFNEGFGEFRLHDGLVDFNAIELSGDAFQLVGRGKTEYTADSAGIVDLNFFTKADDQFLGGLTRVPIAGSLFDNWMHIHVTGTINNPRIEQLPGNPTQYVRGILQDVEKLQRQMLTPFGMPQQGTRPRPPER
ncbi:MAG: hypothetical protein JNG89_07155 [Planctomycetaceae bacterium]|nr:hypothetical protein [Planctomycetaceae bacterium]